MPLQAFNGYSRQLLVSYDANQVASNIDVSARMTGWTMAAGGVAEST
jgi:hypothetical protein